MFRERERGDFEKENKHLNRFCTDLIKKGYFWNSFIQSWNKVIMFWWSELLQDLIGKVFKEQGYFWYLVGCDILFDRIWQQGHKWNDYTRKGLSNWRLKIWLSGWDWNVKKFKW